MSNYRKKDVINDSDIDAFETIEMNKIKTQFKRKSGFRRRLKLVLLLPVIMIAFVLGISLLDDESINPALEGINLAEFTTITLSDLPNPLRGVHSLNAENNLMFLSRYERLNDAITFDDEPDVTGEGQLTLEEIINDQSMSQEAETIFDDLYENIMYLTLDEVASFDDVNEYYFVINDDGTYTLTMRILEDDTFSVVEVKTFYRDEEYFYQVTYEVEVDGDSNLFKVVYNGDNTKKYQYAKYTTDGTMAESYVSIEQQDEYTNVVAINKVDDVIYEVIGNANDEHGVIFTAYQSDAEGKMSSVEYYNQDGALLKNEWGVDNLDLFNESLNEVYAGFEAYPDVTLKNLSLLIDDFEEPASFVIEVALEDAALAAIEEVPATLIVDDETTYTINYAYHDLLYTKKESTFVSGDTMYNMTNREVTDTSVLMTYSAVYSVPDAEIAPNGESYYVVNRYMAKYIEAEEGYFISEASEGNYHLVNEALIGQMGEHVDLDVVLGDYFVDGELTQTTIVQYTSDIQVEHLIFTELDVVNAAKTNLDALYQRLVPSEETLDEQFESIDVSMFND